MPHGHIYIIQNTVRNKYYVGQTTKKNPYHRWHGHTSSLRTGKCRNDKLLRSWNIHGPGAFIFEVVDAAESQCELDALEIQWIAKLNTLENGYNIRHGGNGRGSQSESTKQKIGAAATIRYANSNARLLCGNNKRGVPKSTEHKEKISNTLKGRVIDPEIVAKCSHTNRETWLARSIDEKREILLVSHERAREKHVQNALEKYPLLIDPRGTIHKITTTLIAFSTLHGLQYRKLIGIFKEPHRHHKHWKVYNETV